MNAAVKLVVIAGLASGAAGVTYAVTAPAASASAVHVWIDRPLDGSHVAPGRLAVAAHAAAPGGVDGIALSVDGAATDEKSEGGAPLAFAQLAWDATPGPHHLEVEARHGGSRAVARVTLVVDGRLRVAGGTTTTTAAATTTVPGVTTSTTAPGATSTTGAASATTAPGPGAAGSTTMPTTAATNPGTTAPPPTVAPTTTPTTAPCRGVPPTVTAPGATTTALRPTFSWTYGGPCAPLGFRIEASRSSGFPAQRLEWFVDLGGSARSYIPPVDLPCNIVVYWRIRATASASTSGWVTQSVKRPCLRTAGPPAR